MQILSTIYLYRISFKKICKNKKLDLQNLGKSEIFVCENSGFPYFWSSIKFQYLIVTKY